MSGRYIGTNMSLPTTVRWLSIDDMKTPTRPSLPRLLGSTINRQRTVAERTAVAETTRMLMTALLLIEPLLPDG